MISVTFYYKTFFFSVDSMNRRQSTKKLKFIFIASGNFLGKAKNVILLGLECTVNLHLQNMINIVRDILKK